MSVSEIFQISKSRGFGPVVAKYYVSTIEQVIACTFTYYLWSMTNVLAIHQLGL
jgi:hypothetical protein